MKKVALCIYTDEIENSHYNAADIQHLGYEIFEAHNPNILKALKSVSLKKRLYELEFGIDFGVCIAYNPKCSNIYDLDISQVKENTIHYAYGYFDPHRGIIGGNPVLFCGKSIEFNRACEFINNLKNINRYSRIRSVSESFVFHLRSLLLNMECTNYENSSLFIRSAKID